MQKRSKKDTFISVENPLEYQVLKEQDSQVDDVEESRTTENIQFLRHKALVEALNMLSDKCRLLIENELNDDRKLKDLQEKLGFKNYQALVQAKYNCKKRLVRKVYEVIEKLKEN